MNISFDDFTIYKLGKLVQRYALRGLNFPPFSSVLRSSGEKGGKFKFRKKLRS